MNPEQMLGKHLTLRDFCTCTDTYRRFRDRIDPYPREEATLEALRSLNRLVLDPLIDHFGLERFQLTYGFCSPSLRRYLEKRNPETGERYGRVAPRLDQHMAHERNRNRNYYCKRLGAACDFRFDGVPARHVVDYILGGGIPFDSLYFYGEWRPIHLSHGPEGKRACWTFGGTDMPTPLHRL